MSKNSPPRRIYPVTLGCPKNRTDTEKLLAALKERFGAEIVLAPEEADILFVNTCAFIREAVEESLEVIFELAEEKASFQRLVVAGCLVNRYREELLKELPEVDLFLGIEAYRAPEKVFHSERAFFLRLEGKECTSRILTASPFYAYLKISDGCRRACSFCTIPRIRGPLRSLPEELIIKEAQNLAAQGIQELILVGQDVSAYGLDQGGPRLVPLLKKLLTEVEVPWCRLLYLHPEGITDELLGLIQAEKRIAPYFDIPIQHASPKVLQAMRRSYAPERLLELISKIRTYLPEAALRTSVMVGFPGEGEKEFEELLTFLKEAAFDHLGAFVFSPEEGTLAAKLPDQVPPQEKEARFHEVMQLQQEISAKRLASRLGKTTEVLVEGIDEEGRGIGHAVFQAPEIDGVTYLPSEGIFPGEIIPVRLVSADIYDLKAAPLGRDHSSKNEGRGVAQDSSSK